MMLSEIKIGDWFKFKYNQEILYRDKGSKTSMIRKFSNTDLIYKCVNKHDVSIECVLSGGSLRTQIRFAGQDKTRNSKKDIEDVEVELITDKNIIEELNIY